MGFGKFIKFILGIPYTDREKSDEVLVKDAKKLKREDKKIIAILNRILTKTGSLSVDIGAEERKLKKLLDKGTLLKHEMKKPKFELNLLRSSKDHIKRIEEFSEQIKVNPSAGKNRDWLKLGIHNDFVWLDHALKDFPFGSKLSSIEQDLNSLSKELIKEQGLMTELRREIQFDK